MKKYLITINDTDFDVVARDESSAKNKAVRRANFQNKGESITAASVSHVEYLGFYLNRRFFPAHYVWISRNG